MLDPEYESEAAQLQDIYRQQIYNAEARCADKIAQPLAPSTTYSSSSIWSTSWDQVRRRNREVEAQAVLNIEIETIDRIFMDLTERLNTRYGLE